MSEKELMKVVGFYEGLPIDDPKSFMDEKEQVPVPTSQDLLVKVNAVSVNPVDTKLRQDNGIRNALRILGFDGVGKVVAVGDEVQNFLSAIACFMQVQQQEQEAIKNTNWLTNVLPLLHRKICQMKKPQRCH